MSLRASQINDGGFYFPGSGESAFTTSEVPAALAGVPYGAATHPKAGASVPATGCPNYVPVASAAASVGAVSSNGAGSSAAPSSVATQAGATAAVGDSSSSNGRSGGLDPLVLLLVAVVLILLAGGGLWFYRARSRPR
jgi:cobalamin biosynthesis Mg chelatase CobN